MATENTNPRRMDNRTIDARSRTIEQQIEEAQRKGDTRRVKALSSFGKTLSQQLKEAQRIGDAEAIKNLNLKSGIASASVGTFTGLVDLAVAGYNWGTGSTVKDLRTSVLEATGVPTEGTEGNELTYNLPEYGLMVAGLSQLIKAGWKGAKNLRESRKLKEFTKQLPPAQANRFKQFMMNGQGSNDAELAAILQQLRGDTRYAEFFHQLDTAATKELLKNIAPTPGPMSPNVATRAAVQSVAAKAESLKDARNTAGAVNFTKAQALAGDRPLVKTESTLAALNKLRDEAAGIDSPDSRALVSSIDNLKKTFLETVNQPAVGAPVTIPKTMNAAQFKGLLTEFGRKAATEDALIKGLSSNSLEKLNNAVFGGLTDDLRLAATTAANIDDRKALGELVKARTEYKRGSDAYDSFVSQGIPKFLKDKSIDEIDPEALLSEYSKLNSGQRDLFRSWVGGTYPEALQSLDSRVFNKFVESAYKELPDGTMGIDIGTLARNWAKTTSKTETKAGEADMLAKALGTNFKELDARMKDALVFSRKMDVAKSAADTSESMLDKTQKVLPAVVGSSPLGYQGAQVTDLALKSIQAATGSPVLTADQLMKVLLTPQGASYLKQAALSPRSAATLERLTEVEKVTTPAKSWLASGAVVTGFSPRTPAATEDDGLIDPDSLEQPADTMPMAAPVVGMDKGGDDLIDPDAPMQEQPSQGATMQSMSYAPPATAPAVGSTVGPEEEEKVKRVIESMLMQDPNLNADYVLNAYRQGSPENRQKFLNLYEGSSFK